MTWGGVLKDLHIFGAQDKKFLCSFPLVLFESPRALVVQLSSSWSFSDSAVG